MHPATRAPRFPFQDPDLPLEQRLDDLLSRLTVQDKMAQMLHEAPAISRLDIEAYNWWNECLHGVARAGVATVFPQAIGLAAGWNVERMKEIGGVISDEARAKHHEYVRRGDRDIYCGLTFWSPNINIFRDPRWGRGQETYGECPFLTARLAVAFCQGLQGDSPDQLKVVATPKHYAVHSGPEGLRHGFNAIVSAKDLMETYLPAFHACVTEARVESVMSAYNRVNGEPCSGSETLLRAILRDQWRFDGYVVSDCWAIDDFHAGHQVSSSPAESAARAVAAGCDLECGCTYLHLPAALEAGLVTEAQIDSAVRRLFRARMRLGMLDPPERDRYASIPYEVIESAPHRAMAKIAARESMVLLQNPNDLLPLRKDLETVAVIGPNAYDPLVLAANYAGTQAHVVTPLEGIRGAVSAKTRVIYAEGCKRTGTTLRGVNRRANLSEAVSAAIRADAVVLCLGLSAELEGEQGEAADSAAQGDRMDLGLPGLQQRLLEEVVAVGKPTVLVLLSGSPIDVSWATQRKVAILQAWYPGQEGGTALAEVLFGEAAPSGRLPITFPAKAADLPPFTDYSMRGRTYRYLEQPPLFPFGYGLSYTRFAYREATAVKPRVSVGEAVEVAATVVNEGPRAADEVVQLYVQDLAASFRLPQRELRGFTRIHLAPGEARRVSFKLGPRELSFIDDLGRRVLEPGRFRVTVGGSQDDPRSVELAGSRPAAVELEVVGEPSLLPY